MKPTKTPSVTMTALISGPVSTGRTMTRSTSAPMTKPETSATTKRQPVRVAPLDERRARGRSLNIACAPCPKLMIRVARKISTQA